MACITDASPELRPGYWWADWIPGLNYLPDGLAPWRAEARRTFENMTEFWSVFFDAIVDRMHKGDPPDCFLTRFLESPEVVNFSNIDRRAILSELLSAGSETTATALQWFFKAAVLYPDFVKSAQEELDRVVGPARLPGWEDRSNLPYLAATVEELHRWSSVAPVAVFHATSERDSYRDKTIPAGTTIINNFYAVHHNDEYYRHHDRFMPERFLSDKDPRYLPGLRHAPVHYGFGVGRRECPGKHVADASLFILTSRLLWAFDIKLGPNPPPSDEISKLPSMSPCFPPTF
jgi:cytochrome P450